MLNHVVFWKWANCSFKNKRGTKWKRAICSFFALLVKSWCIILHLWYWCTLYMCPKLFPKFTLPWGHILSPRSLKLGAFKPVLFTVHSPCTVSLGTENLASGVGSGQQFLSCGEMDGYICHKLLLVLYFPTVLRIRIRIIKPSWIRIQEVKMKEIQKVL